MDLQHSDYLPLPSRESLLEGILAILSMNEGIIKLTGEPGIGKTLLCRELARRLEESGHRTFLVNHPPASAAELEAALVWALDLDETRNFSRALEDALTAEGEAFRPLILILDDADAIADDAYTVLRMFNNLQHNGHPLVQVILCGSPALNLRLEQPEQRALTQYLVQSFVLEPFGEEESETFFRDCFRKVAGEEPTLALPARRLLQSRTRGRPAWIATAATGLAIHRHDQPFNAAVSAGDLKPWLPGTSTVAGIPQGWLKVAVPVTALLVLGTGILLWYPSTPPPERSSPDSPDTSRPVVAVEPPPQDAETIPEADAEIIPETVPEEITPTPPPEALVPVTLIAPPASDEVADIQDSNVAGPAPEEIMLESALNDALQSWLAAWEAQDLEAYFSAYHPDFVPAYLASREAWREQRRERIREPERIEVTHEADSLELVEGMEVGDPRRVTVRFTLDYATPDYADRSLKELELERLDGRWLILDERNLTVDRLR